LKKYYFPLFHDLIQAKTPQLGDHHDLKTEKSTKKRLILITKSSEKHILRR
jgi:hypothetical protein